MPEASGPGDRPPGGPPAAERARSGRLPPSEGAPPREGWGYPLFRRNDRRLPEDWAGPVYVWDIDNTYLVTEWAGLRDLIRIRFEAAEDKRPVPGAVELLAALRRGAGLDERPPVYFVSASPETMRATLERRMLLDGVAHDGITFRSLRRLRYLRDIFGYKLAALLLYRLEHPRGAHETLFGDDREHDPEVYLTYARVCAGALRGEALRELAQARGVGRSAARYLAALADELPGPAGPDGGPGAAWDPVEWIVIRRLRPGCPGPAEALAMDDPRLVFVDHFGQAAALLRALGRIEADDLARVLAAARAAGLEGEPLGPLERVAAGPRGRALPAPGLARARAEVARLLAPGPGGASDDPARAAAPPPTPPSPTPGVAR